MKALLVGLRADTREIVERVLTAQSRELLDASSIADALQHLQPACPEMIIISDANVDVVAACKAIRAIPHCQDSIILVVVNTHATEDILERLLGAGANDFFMESQGEEILRGRLRFADRSTVLMRTRREAEEDRRLLFEMSTDALCIAGFDGYFKRLNPTWSKVLGWTIDELLAEPWVSFVHPEDVNTTITAGEQLADGSVVSTFANRYRCKNGEYRWLEWNSVPVVERGLIFAVARDVTAETTEHRALQALTSNLATTLRSIGDGVISTDASAIVAGMNPVAELLTGWTAKEAIGTPMCDVFRIINEETRAPVTSPVDRVLAEGIVLGLPSHTALVRRDGTEIPIADRCAPMKDEAGRVIGSVLVFRDKTAENLARKQTELIQQQLIFSDRMASVGTLAAGVAHEINNPLSYIMSNLEMIAEEVRELSGGSTSSRMRDLEDMVKEASQGAERVRKIVRGLKTFSRSDEERRTVIKVIPVVELSINMAFNEIRHRARLVKDYGETPLVEADEARLGQVFINLLVNAAQALPEGHTDANEIRVVTSTSDSGNAVIEVRDSGPGIPPALLERIFDPFFTTKGIGIGTGLGLSICRNIVTGMGGDISVESDERGTAIRVTLPGVHHATLEDPLAGATANGNGKKRAAVLIVDDEPAVGITLGRVLREHSVTVTTSGKEALSLIESGETFDVVLSDLMMPEMSGMELYHELTRRFPESAERMVFVTGGAFTPDANAFLDGVPNERLDKPFDIKTIRALVSKFIK